MTKYKIANYKILENYNELKQYYPLPIQLNKKDQV